MRITLKLLPLSLLLIALGCGTQNESSTQETAAPKQIPGTAAGAVVETMDAGGYTYVQLDTADGKIWAAGPQTQVTVGQVLRVSTGMPMQNFHSDALDRTFPTLYFANALTPDGASDPAAQKKLVQQSHPHGPPAASADISFEDIPAADYTVADLYAKRGDLGGQTVKVRGKVVKVLKGIMDRNWLHVQDGTGEGATKDLVVTSDGTAEEGQTVLVTGTVALDQDFGMGYQYDLILEKATVQPETD
jgi:hypothetical protein